MGVPKGTRLVDVEDSEGVGCEGDEADTTRQVTIERRQTVERGRRDEPRPSLLVTRVTEMVRETSGDVMDPQVTSVSFLDEDS